MPDMNDEVFDHVHGVRADAARLRFLARAFSVVGNNQVADELRCIAADLDDSTKRLTDAWSGHLSDELAKSQKAIADTLLTVLHVTPTSADD